VPQAVWTGQLSFGLVNIPVRLYSATAAKNVRFHHYDAQSGRRVRYRRVASGPSLDAPAASSDRGSPPPEAAPLAPGAQEPPAATLPGEPAEQARGEPEVLWEDIVKGYEIEPGRVVTITPEELASVAPERSRVLEVERFVPLRDIDPVYFEKSYYVVPQAGVGAERPYRLLYRAMAAGEEVAVGRFVMRTKEYLAAVRPAEHLLMLETLFYADEVRDPKELGIPPAEEPPERELLVARQFIEALAGKWDPTRLRDEHRERLLDLLRSKAGDARAVPEPPDEARPSPVVDLIEALQASVEAAKRARREDRRDRKDRKETG
jgi:DNA end-binding protein Ku